MSNVNLPHIRKTLAMQAEPTKPEGTDPPKVKAAALAGGMKAVYARRLAKVVRGRKRR